MRLRQNFINDMCMSNVKVGYASETGTAYSLARYFTKRCAKWEVSLEQLSSQTKLTAQCIWVFFIATAGQGEFPFSARSFWGKLLRKNYALEPGLRFAVYSLADSSYGQNFGAAARKLRQRLKMLGAEEVLEIGLGDDQDSNGYRQQYDNQWEASIFSYLSLHAAISFNPLLSYLHQKTDSSVPMKILRAKQINSKIQRKTYFIDFAYPLQINLNVGNVLSIYPHNCPKKVKQILAYFKIQDPNQQILFQGQKMTILKLLTQILNISSTVQYEFFLNNLKDYANNILHRNKLQEIEKNFSEYFDYVRKYKRNVIQVLQDFELTLQFEDFINRVDKIFPRKYSVASLNKQQKIVSVLLRLVQVKINSNKIYNGFCTNDLVNNQSSFRRVSVYQGQFLLPQQKKQTILIGLGTGIAPLIPIISTTNNSRIKLYFSNKYSDQCYHRQIIKGHQLFQQQTTFTQEGGIRIVKLLQNEVSFFQNIFKHYELSQICVYVCAPRQICQFVDNLFFDISTLTKAQFKKLKIVVAQNW